MQVNGGKELGLRLAAEQGVYKLSRYRWAIFAVAVLDGALLSFHYSWGATLSGYHAREWALEADELGLLAALGFFPYALMQIPGGYITDRFGVRKVMSATIAVMALGTALFAVAQSYNDAALARILIAIGSAVILLPSLKILARWFPENEFATIQGAFLLISMAGSLAATLPLAIAAERFGWRIPMFAVAVLTSVGAILSWLILRNDPVEVGLPSVRPAEPPGTRDHDGTAAKPSLRRGFRAWISVTNLWATSLIFFASYGSLQAFQSLWAGPVLRQLRGMSVEQIGQSLLFFTMGIAIGPLLFGYISDHVHARKPIVVGCTLAETAIWILIFAGIGQVPVSILHIAFFLVSLLAGGVLVGQVMITETCPPNMFGTIFGIINGWAFYGTAAIQIIAGLVLTAIGPVAVAEEPIYSERAYLLALSPIIFFMLVATVLSFRLDETTGPKRVSWPARLS